MPDRDHGSSSTFDRIDGISLAAMVLCAVALVMGRSWLGLRRFMADHGRFEDCPAAAVQIWDRYPAHAVALDLAPRAAQQLPLGAESDRWA